MDRDNYKELEILQSVNKISNKWSLPANGQKPCITRLVDQSIPEGFRNQTIHIVACDLLNRQELPFDNVYKIIEAWNGGFSSPLPISEVNGTLRNAERPLNNGDKRTYGCNNLRGMLEATCLGKENCPFYAQLKSNSPSRTPSTFDLIKSSAFHQSSGNEVKLYLVLMNWEKQHGIRIGNTIVASHEKLAKKANMTKPTIGKCLENLHMNGLIEYKRGKQHKHVGQASEIRRIIPLPD